MLPILLSLIIFGALATGGLFMLLKSFAKKTTAGNSSGMTEIENSIQQLDEHINRSFEYFDQMLPLGDAVQKEQEIAAVRADLAVESKKLADLDAQLTKLQAAVETAEAAHNELKKGKEDSDKLADEVRSKKDQLAAETKAIEGELAQSRAKLDVLSEEVSLTKDQKIALNSVTSSIDASSKQLLALSEVYTVAATRFSNLENQYRELEKEFTKLVEKELSGKLG
ncbi:MAG: hypothetical protein U0136_04715 [Bdellovibrionota bacterium]